MKRGFSNLSLMELLRTFSDQMHRKWHTVNVGIQHMLDLVYFSLQCYYNNYYSSFAERLKSPVGLPLYVLQSLLLGKEKPKSLRFVNPVASLNFSLNSPLSQEDKGSQANPANLPVVYTPSLGNKTSSPAARRIIPGTSFPSYNGRI